MRQMLQLISAIALCLTIFPSLLYFAGRVELGTMKWLLMAATVIWFVVTPLWMGREKKNRQAVE